MSKYQSYWDLATIPDSQWASENGRRQRTKAPARTYVKLAPCKGCKRNLTATERRGVCPNCGTRNRAQSICGQTQQPPSN
jgi:hypothetical protein